MTRLDDIRRRCGGRGFWPLSMAQEDARWVLRWFELALPILRSYVATYDSGDLLDAVETLLEEVDNE